MASIHTVLSTICVANSMLSHICVMIPCKLSACSGKMGPFIDDQALVDIRDSQALVDIRQVEERGLSKSRLLNARLYIYIELLVYHCIYQLVMKSEH